VTEAVSALLDELVNLDPEAAPSDDGPPQPNTDGSAGLDDIGDPPAPKKAPAIALSKDQVAALEKRGLPTTPAAWRALCKTAARRPEDAPRFGGAKPVLLSRAEAAAGAGKPVMLSKAEVAQKVAELSPAMKRAAEAKGMTPEEFVQRRLTAARRV
jgi:hypothetical protein